MIRDWMGIFSSSDTVNPTQLWNESSGILWLSAPGTTHQETTLKFHLSSWDDGGKPASLDLKKIQSEPRTRRGHSQQWSMTTRLGQSASLQEEEVHVGVLVFGRWEKTHRGGPLWKIQFLSDGRIDGHTCASTVRKRAEMSVLLWALSDLNSCAATRRKPETNEHSFHAPRTSVSLLDR